MVELARELVTFLADGCHFASEYVLGPERTKLTVRLPGVTDTIWAPSGGLLRTVTPMVPGLLACAGFASTASTVTRCPWYMIVMEIRVPGGWPGLPGRLLRR